jgi:signal transduction histidine kinase
MRILLRPLSLIARLTLVLVAAVVANTVGTALVHRQEELHRSSDFQVGRIAEQLVLARRVLSATEADQRPLIARQLATRALTIEWPATPAASLPDGENNASSWLRRLVDHQPELVNFNLVFTQAGNGADDDPFPVEGHLRLVDGSSLQFAIAMPEERYPGFVKWLLTAAIMSGSILGTGAMVMRALNSPLRALTKAADALGHGQWAPVAVSGPRDVRQLAEAFNAMQARILRLIDDRTQALAAVSHDLRTPIARLRLRMDALCNGDLQGAATADLDEMEKMVASLLAFLKGQDDPEKPRPIDLVALLTTLVDDAVDQGGEARYEGPPRLMLTLRPLGIKRALSNLLENALLYAGSVRVCLKIEEREARILIEDKGPGIPEPELDRVFEPFHRLEQSRNRATGGTGLGLAIARGAVEREGGSIALLNRPEGGLSVSITLPLA